MRLITTVTPPGQLASQSSGSVCVIDLDQQSGHKVVDFEPGRFPIPEDPAERGPRGMALDHGTLYLVANNELLAFSRKFELLGRWQCAYLADCQELAVWQRTLYLTSAGFDTILGFHLDEKRFFWAMHVQRSKFRFKPVVFDPSGADGPIMLNKLSLNSIYCSRHGMYISGEQTGGMLHFNGKAVRMAVELPAGIHNARPFRDGVLFNDSHAGALRYTGRGEGHEDRAMKSPLQDKPGALVQGLCVMSDQLVAGGHAPATISVYDLAQNEHLASVSLNEQPGQEIHSILVWSSD